MNKIQFQKGISLNQFLAKYGAEQQCEAALEDARAGQKVSVARSVEPKSIISTVVATLRSSSAGNVARKRH